MLLYWYVSAWMLLRVCTRTGQRSRQKKKDMTQCTKTNRLNLLRNNGGAVVIWLVGARGRAWVNVAGVAVDEERHAEVHFLQQASANTREDFVWRADVFKNLVDASHDVAAAGHLVRAPARAYVAFI